MASISESQQVAQALLGARQLHNYLKTPQGHKLIGPGIGSVITTIALVIELLEDRRKALHEALPGTHQLTVTQGTPPLDTPVHPEEAT